MSVEITFVPPAINPVLVLTATKEAAELAGAKELLRKSLPLVPFDEGDLYASGDFGHDETGGYVTFSAVNKEDGYDYAAIQHEDMNFDHHGHGQAKYVEQPMEQDGAAIIAAIGAIIAKAL